MQASPISRWPTLYLVGWLSTRGSIRSLHLAQNGNLYFEATHPILSESDKAFIRGLSRASDRFMIVRQIASPRTQGLVPGWFSAPEPNPEFVNIIRGILSPRGTIWHETRVELVAFRFGLRKRREKKSTVWVSACLTILPAAAAGREHNGWITHWFSPLTSQPEPSGIVPSNRLLAVREPLLLSGPVESSAKAATLVRVSDLARPLHSDLTRSLAYPGLSSFRSPHSTMVRECSRRSGERHGKQAWLARRSHQEQALGTEQERPLVNTVRACVSL